MSVLYRTEEAIAVITLDRLMLSIAPVTLGAGRPLFPRPFDLRLVELAPHGVFVCATYDVVGSRGA